MEILGGTIRDGAAGAGEEEEGEEGGKNSYFRLDFSWPMLDHLKIINIFVL